MAEGTPNTLHHPRESDSMTSPIGPDMRAFRFTGVDAPLEDVRVPIPELRPGWALVRVRAAAICGSDVHIREGHTPVSFTPITLGHEIAGDVAALRADDGNGGSSSDGGSDGGGVAVGDRVFVNPIVGCGNCSYCEARETNFCPGRGLLGIAFDGGLAEYVAAPIANLTVMPATIGYAEIAMAESAATAYHALRVLAARAGDSVVIVGAGGLGLQTVRIAAALGLRVLSVDPSAAARERAVAAGAELAISPEEAAALAQSGEYVALAERLGSTFGFAHAVDCVGFESTVDTALQMLRPRGSLSIIGIGSEGVKLPNPAIFVRRSLQVRGIYTYTVEDVAAVLDLLVSGRVRLSDSVSRTLPLDAADEAFTVFTSAEPRPVRVVLEP